MHRYFFSLRIAGLVVLAAIAVAFVDLWLRGFAVVYDPDNRLASAALVSAESERPMREFAEHYWAGRADGDAHFLLRCHNGGERRVGYVTPGLQVTHEVSAADCVPPVAAPRLPA
ncbi:hypothetical protein [Sphingomonas japonica]|uniref:Uncharacterized protein n=1 Tax=Sphingomonas japonica TaxID=511662 RepID=A0ABX0U423_9SPHN|nr:hypothetical protein [Sphingomonas japonica]NIJ24411.1 hypothetical protein [Sphingomonas japonica]